MPLKIDKTVVNQFNFSDDGSLEFTTIEDLLLEKLMNFGVKKALRLNSTWGEQSSAVFYALLGDFMKPAIDKGDLVFIYVYFFISWKNTSRKNRKSTQTPCQYKNVDSKN